MGDWKGISEKASATTCVIYILWCNDRNLPSANFHIDIARWANGIGFSVSATHFAGFSVDTAVFSAWP